jgi:xylulokinase
MNLLGIDVGTGGTRAVVIDERGQIVASATAEHAAFASPQTGWAEQDARDWWQATQRAVRTVLANTNGAAIACVGLSGQMHGATLLDGGGQVLRPALIWCDGRTSEQCRTITQRIGAERLIDLVGNPAIAGFTLPKLLWVREHEPEIWREVRAVLLPKDYVRWQLTGEFATDVADASGTLLFDVVGRKWSQEMLSQFDIAEGILPVVWESAEVCGRVSRSGAEATGLLEGTPVVAGAGDQAAGAVGMGIVQAGVVSATIGTSGVVFAATDRPAFDQRGRVHTFCHAIPNRWHVMGVTQAAGLSLRWFRDTFGVANPLMTADAFKDTQSEQDPYEVLCAEAATVPAGADGVIWTPYLMGERTPHLDPLARAALVGLTANHTRAHIVRAILEGVAFSLRDTLGIFAEMNVPVETIRLGGGGARSPLWRQIQADVYGQTVEVVEAEEGAAYGAALLAGVGIQVWESVDEACNEVVHVAGKIEPDDAAAAMMNLCYEKFRALYPALRAVLG